MFSIKNHVQLIGYLGRDAEVKRFDNGKVVASSSIATTETYRNAKGDKVEQTQWHNIKAWGKSAELMEKYFKKGTGVALSGKLVHQKYTDKEGIERNATEVLISDFTFMEKKGN